MTDDVTRPNPDDLLAKVNADEAERKQGKLKIFLGYAAGVGKTYTMLESVRARMHEIDVVVALAETHGRAETEALLDGLFILPRKEISYRGVTLTEMDIDAVLARKPKLAIVDELAHTNAPESRHPKRYQDVEELLDAGIDVYTTLNIQHVESLRNIVAQITGVWIRETVPDSIIDRASEIELVDLPPDELIKRLREGKVYVSDQIGRAIEEFFRKGNLAALRELSMRTAAERVDEQVRAYMGQHAIRGPWPTSERVLVGISAAAEGANLVRAGRRLSDQLGCEWFVVHVETGGDLHLSSREQDRLAINLRLAGRMGAKVVTVQGESVADSLSHYAVKNHVTKIVVAKSRRGFTRAIRPSIADKLIQLSDAYDVQITAGVEKDSGDKSRQQRPQQFRVWRYVAGLGIVALATLLNWLLRPALAPTVLMTSYLISVVVAAVYLGLGASILVSVTSVLVFDFFFIPPYLTFATADVQYTITLFSLLLIGIIISYFTSRLRQNTVVAQRHERQTMTLYTLGRELAILNDLELYIHAIVKSAGETFGHTATIFLSDPEGKTLQPHLHGTNTVVDDNERAAAVWSFEHQKQVGFGTDTLPDAKGRYIPLTTARGTVGVLALWGENTKPELTIDQEQLLEAFADLASVAIEGILLTEEAKKRQILETQEKLQTALLNSISHDLRTPLVAIIGAMSTLKDEGAKLDESARRNLVEVALQEGERLNHLLSNLLDMSRIEAGALKLSIQPAEVQDLIGAALENTGKRWGMHPVQIDIPENPAYIAVDSGLIVQAFINILDNSFKYSPPGSAVDIITRTVNNRVEIDIADRGVGIPSYDLERVFDKFYRLQHPEGVTGTGLGLSIVKGIVEAHGGTVTATNRPGGGTIIRVTLPVKPDLSGKNP